MKTGTAVWTYDTGLDASQRMIPAAAVRRVDHADRTVHVSLTKAQIKDAPDFERDHMQDMSYDDRYGSYYGTFL